MTQIRIATFNLENFDEAAPGVPPPSLDERIALMKPQITRLRADIACFQEVHGQECPGQPRDLLALKGLLAGANLGGAPLTSTKPRTTRSSTCATWSSPPSCRSSSTSS